MKKNIVIEKNEAYFELIKNISELSFKLYLHDGIKVKYNNVAKKEYHRSKVKNSFAEFLINKWMEIAGFKKSRKKILFTRYLDDYKNLGYDDYDKPGYEYCDRKFGCANVTLVEMKLYYDGFHVAIGEYISSDIKERQITVDFAGGNIYVLKCNGNAWERVRKIV